MPSAALQSPLICLRAEAASFWPRRGASPNIRSPSESIHSELEIRAPRSEKLPPRTRTLDLSRPERSATATDSPRSNSTPKVWSTRASKWKSESFPASAPVRKWMISIKLDLPARLRVCLSLAPDSF